MLPPPPIERITLPAAPEPPPPAAFPWAATLAPVAMSLALWAITRSVYGLMFAALGPLVALGAALDGRLGRRRTARREMRRAAEQRLRTVERIAAAQQRERGRLLRLVADVSAPAWHGVPHGPIPVRMGSGTGASAVEVEGPDADEVRAAVPHRGDAPVLLDALDGVGIVGPPALAAAVARSLAVQVAASLSPAHARLTAPPGESWCARLPHELVTTPDATAADANAFRWTWAEGGLTIAWAEAAHLLPPDCGQRVDTADLTPIAQCAAEAGDAAAELARRADVLGLRPPGSDLPAAVPLAELLTQASALPGLGAVIGRDAAGPVVIDLVAEGPHALVAGTTGSGKSELLVSWVLAMASGRTPAELSLLLVDFKGGASFTPLAALPHVVATLSDLDPRLTRRAIESLRAELLRRERVLAQAGVRAIDELAPGMLARLVIVVDEFAAVVAASPDLHEVFADLAARGRSLGLHLVLCTQRPAGVVRDAVLANIGLRISLRVTDRGDSIAMVGDDAASRLPLQPVGRAILVRDGQARAVQVAIAARDDAGRIAAASPADQQGRPWCDPLPADLSLDAVTAPARDDDEPGVPFGLVDLPAEQRQPPAVYDPARHGHLLVLGAAGAGSSTTLVTLATSARQCGMPVCVIADDPADAWAQLAALAAGGFEASSPPLVLIDGLDTLFGRIDPDHRHELTELLAGLLRAGAAGAPAIVATARRLGGALAGLAGLFGSRLLLRQSSRDEHAMAGGEHGAFDPDLPAGSGTWRGVVVQVARVRGAALPAPAVPAAERVVVGADPVLALVAARPQSVLGALRATGVRVLQLGRDVVGDPEEVHVVAGGAPTVVIGDPDAWQAEWALLTAARREWPIALLGCSPADHRVLLRASHSPPPIGTDPAECWLFAGGRTVRAVLELPSARESEEKHPSNR